MRVRKQLTLCGIRPRAWVAERRVGAQLTYEWPCGYRKTEPLMVGKGRRTTVAGESVATFMARYWRKEYGDVTYECPRCRRAARRAIRLACRYCAVS